MWSLSARLFRSLLVGQLVIIVLIATATAIALFVSATDYFKTRLEHDRDLLLQEIHWHDDRMDIDEHILPPIFVALESGHYYQVNWNGQQLKSPSLGDRALEMQRLAGETLWSWQQVIPEQNLYVMSQSLTVGQRQVELQIAEDFLPIMDVFVQAFVTLLLLLSVLMAAIFVWQRRQLNEALLPFEQIQQQLRQLARQERDHLEAPEMQELEPLVDEINRLGERTRERLLRARMASGNLSHSLKTPLAVLNNRLNDVARSQPEGDWHISLQQIEQMNHMIDNEMKRARIAGLMSRAPQIDLTELLQQLCQSMAKLYPEVIIRQQLPAALPFPGDREDMFELLGNLVDNACKWTSTTVDVQATEIDGQLQLTITDNGPGVAPEQLTVLHQPGVRGDESGPGFGLGLAIVADIVEQYQGRIRFENGAEAGLIVRLSLPLNPDYR
ncbi:sensor histidine kinase [Oceanobacter sp. 5_MG-2023]|uniref:sensor histidine kinase n=1 Tax=Oceanobacter sp. 5_MG-2023 TaxID=3062645 RepID=UPI0026E13BE4|nr:sensor histidine kinase [Oceanobacter sp. 5_MG-2023]MDO6682306.1 sensor histidine kinase [Oceanobacter sp. 5_MG-2023]